MPPVQREMQRRFESEAIYNPRRPRRSSHIDSQEQVGGWPALASKAAPIDSDDDGLPDSWERRYGLNAHDPTDAVIDTNKDGYTNLEEYLNSIRPKQ